MNVISEVTESDGDIEEEKTRIEKRKGRVRSINLHKDGISTFTRGH